MRNGFFSGTGDVNGDGGLVFVEMSGEGGAI